MTSRFFGTLHAAAIKGDKEELKSILKNSQYDVNGKDKLGRTALLFAVLGQHSDCVEILMEKGARPDIQDVKGKNALAWAISSGSDEIIQILLNNRSLGQASQVLQVDTSGMSVIHSVAEKLGISSKITRKIIKKFVAENGNINIQDEHNQTPLHWACRYGNIEVVNQLLGNGANVDVLDNEKKTPLHIVTLGMVRLSEDLEKFRDQSNEMDDLEDKFIQCAIAVLKAGIHIANWRDQDGCTPIHYAAMVRGSSVLVKLFADNGPADTSVQDKNGSTALHFAALFRNNEVVTFLLERYSSTSIQDINGATPLHCAVSSGSESTVEIIIKQPDVTDNIVDCRGRNALMWAAGFDKAGIVRILCKHGGLVNQQDQNGDSALHLAVSENHIETANALIHLGASLHLENFHGETPLCYAGKLGHTEALILLISLGADPNHKNHKQLSPIHSASREGHGPILQILLHHSIQNPDGLSRINEVDAYGRSSLIYAASGGYNECAKLLLDHGADVNAVDHQGMSGVHWGVLRGHLDILRLLIENNAFLNNLANLPHGKIHETFMPGWKKKQKVFWEKSANTFKDNFHRGIRGIYDTLRMTPLDIALICKESEIAQLLIDNGGLTFVQIRDLAALKIQTMYRCYRIKSSFEEFKELQIRHQQLLEQKKKSKLQGRHPHLRVNSKEAEHLHRVEHVAGAFISEMVVDARFSSHKKSS